MSGLKSPKNVMPFGMKNSVRYDLDFRIIPGMVNDEFIRELLKEREQLFRKFFNRHYQLIYPLFFEDAPPQFQDSDFSCKEASCPDGKHILYVTLPQEHRGSSVFCEAYAFAYRQTSDQITDIRFFTIERSDWGTGCIGTTTADGAHLNFGPLAETEDGNMERIQRIAFGE